MCSHPHWHQTLQYSLTGYCIRYTCSIVCYHKQLISQSQPTQSVQASGGDEDDLKFKLSIRMWEKQDLSERDIIVCARPSEYFKKLLIRRDFNTQPSLGFVQEVSSSCVDKGERRTGCRVRDETPITAVTTRERRTSSVNTRHAKLWQATTQAHQNNVLTQHSHSGTETTWDHGASYQISE